MPTPPPPSTSPVVPAASAEARAHAAEVAAWRQERLAKLTSETGFLALAGLYWLKEGTASLGSADGAAIKLPPRAPAGVGTITRATGKVTFTAADSVAATCAGSAVTSLELRSDADLSKKPHRIAFDGFTFIIISRDERLGLRLWDRQASTRTGFVGIPTYPVDLRWKVKARYAPYPEPKPISIPTVVKTRTEAFLTGEVTFELAGAQHTLYPIAWPGDRELFFHFTDRTTGQQTYGGGRFLVAKHPVDRAGQVTLDFNKLYTPPCAFTDYATCPVPLAKNRLLVSIEAGERQ